MKTNFNIKFSNYGEFRNFLLKELGEFLPKEYMENHIIRPVTIPTEQYGTGEGICFMDVRGLFDKQKVTCPTLPIKHLYDMYKRDGFIHVVDGILHLIDNTSNQDDMDEFELSEETVVSSICSIKNNKELLSKVPHRKIFDFAIYYMGKFKDGNGKYSTGFLITNEHLNKFNTTEDELFKYSMKGGKNNYRLVSFYNVIKDEDCDGSYMIALLGKKFLKNVYIVTSNYNIGGGSLMANINVLNEISQKMDDDFYIVPTTENEFVIFPYSIHKNKTLILNLKNMFRDMVNSNGKEELENNLYLYKRSENNIFIYAD